MEDNKGADEKAGDQKAAKPADQKPTLSMQSGLTSSLMETSEDSEARKEKEDKKGAKGSKGLTEADLKLPIDVEMTETDTNICFFIPSVIGIHETEEYNEISEENSKYELLLSNKKGSDSYEPRGSQTMNN